MSTINEKDQDKMGLSPPDRNSEIDHAIASAEASIINTEKFLTDIRESQAGARDYVEEVRTQMTEQLAYLKSRRDFLLKDSQADRNGN